jgi:hypothetical protein
VGVDEIKFTIQKCFLLGKQVIVKGKDLAEVAFVKIINVENSKTKYYFEGEKFLFSGCGKFVWDLTKNEVIDI